MPRKKKEQTLADCFFGGVEDLVFWSFRYFLGRQTIATCQFAEDLARAWPLLDEQIQHLIMLELETEFERDDKSRNGGGSFYPLGADCDRRQWEKVRSAYCAKWKESE